MTNSNHSVNGEANKVDDPVCPLSLLTDEVCKPYYGQARKEFNADLKQLETQSILSNQSLPNRPHDDPLAVLCFLVTKYNDMKSMHD
jgi:hypothetical protein